MIAHFFLRLMIAHFYLRMPVAFLKLNLKYKNLLNCKLKIRSLFEHVSQYVIGCTCHNESMLIGLFKQRQFADERKWLFESADVRGGGNA